jgi:hypothetical protein
MICPFRSPCKLVLQAIFCLADRGQTLQCDVQCLYVDFVSEKLELYAGISVLRVWRWFVFHDVKSKPG